jgi:hypothetical protein
MHCLLLCFLSFFANVKIRLIYSPLLAILSKKCFSRLPLGTFCRINGNLVCTVDGGEEEEDIFYDAYDEDVDYMSAMYDALDYEEFDDDEEDRKDIGSFPNVQSRKKWAKTPLYTLPIVTIDK